MPLVVFREEETKFVEELTKLLEEGIRKEIGLGDEAFEEGGSGGVGLEEGEDPGSEERIALDVCGTEGGCAGLGT